MKLFYSDRSYFPSPGSSHRGFTPLEIPLRFLKPNPRQVFVDSLDYISGLES